MTRRDRELELIEAQGCGPEDDRFCTGCFHQRSQHERGASTAHAGCSALPCPCNYFEAREPGGHFAGVWSALVWVNP